MKPIRLTNIFFKILCLGLLQPTQLTASAAKAASGGKAAVATPVTPTLESIEATKLAVYKISGFSADEQSKIDETKRSFLKRILDEQENTCTVSCHATQCTIDSAFYLRMAIDRTSNEVVPLSKEFFEKIEPITGMSQELITFAEKALKSKNDCSQFKLLKDFLEEKNWDPTDIALALNFPIKMPDTPQEKLFTRSTFSEMLRNSKLRNSDKCLKELLNRGADPLAGKSADPILQFDCTLMIALGNLDNEWSLAVKQMLHWIHQTQQIEKYHLTSSFLAQNLYHQGSLSTIAFLNAGADPLDDLNFPEQSITTVFLAAQKGDSELLELLLKKINSPEKKAELLNRPCQNITPLAVACRKEFPLVVKILLENKASPKRSQKENLPPLLEAVLGKGAATPTVEKRLISIKHLIEAGADWFEPYPLLPPLSAGIWRMHTSSALIFLMHPEWKLADFVSATDNILNSEQWTQPVARGDITTPGSSYSGGEYTLLALAFTWNRFDIANWILRSKDPKGTWLYLIPSSDDKTPEKITFNHLVTIKPSMLKEYYPHLDSDCLITLLTETETSGIPFMYTLALDKNLRQQFLEFYQSKNIDQLLAKFPDEKALLKKIIDGEVKADEVDDCWNQQLSTVEALLEKEADDAAAARGGDAETNDDSPDDDAGDADADADADAEHAEAGAASPAASTAGQVSDHTNATHTCLKKPNLHKLYRKQIKQFQKALQNWKMSLILPEEILAHEHALVTLIEQMDKSERKLQSFPQQIPPKNPFASTNRAILEGLGEGGKMGHAYNRFHSHKTSRAEIRLRADEEKLAYTSCFTEKGIDATLKARVAIARWAIAQKENGTAVKGRLAGSFIVDGLQGRCYDARQKEIIDTDGVRAVVEWDAAGEFSLVTMYPTPALPGRHLRPAFQPTYQVDTPQRIINEPAH